MKINKLNHPEHFDMEMPEGGVLEVDKDLYLFGEITPQSTAMFMSSFQQSDSVKGPISIYICSMGGWVEGGLCMYDIIRGATNKVITIGCGAVYSAAILPFEAGDVRLMYKSCRLLLHDMTLNVGEIKYNDIKGVSDSTKEVFDMSCNYIAKRAGTKLSIVQELCKTDTFLNAQKCLHFNLIDKILKETSHKLGDK